jgi:transcriptional regulator with XRE-family HTH domain
MDNISIAFGRWLHAIRIDGGMSQTSLEKQFGIPRGRIRQYEDGEGSVTIYRLEKIVSGLGRDFTDLFLENILGINKNVPEIARRTGTLQNVPTLENLLAMTRPGQPGHNASFLYPKDINNETIEAVFCSGGAVFAQDFSMFLLNARLEKGYTICDLERISKITQTTLGRYERLFPNRLKVSSILALDHALGLDGALFAIAWRVAEFYNTTGLNSERTQRAENLLRRHRTKTMQEMHAQRKQNFAPVDMPADSLEVFLAWIDEQLRMRNWTDYRLMKNAGCSESVIRKARNQGKPIKWEACTKIATALNLPAELVFRKAGLLPARDPIVDEACNILSIMKEADQHEALCYIQQLNNFPESEGTTPP